MSWRAEVWLGQYKLGHAPEALAAAQRTLDRATEGGFFARFEGRPRDGESMAEVRREMLDEAAALLDDPSVEVHLTTEELSWDAASPPWKERPWRTRLVAIPKGQ